MGTESTTPPHNPADEKPQNSASDLVKPMDGEGQDAKVEGTKETSTQSVFVNSEPMREEQVQNAVKFLSHPKVRGSPVIYRRSFLEKKGLTKEEIDESFRRVPDPPPTVTSVQATTSNQDGQLKSSTNTQSQAPAQIPQSAAAAPTGVISTVATMPQSRFHWSHALLGVGLLAASGAGTAVLFKNAVVPRLESWIRKVVSEDKDDPMKKTNSKPSLAEEAAAAAKAAAVAAANVAKASQEMLNSKNEEKRYFEALMSVLDVQVEEMKSMSNAIRKLEDTREISLSSNKQIEEHVQSESSNGPSKTPWRTLVDREDPRGSLTSSKQAKANGLADFDMGSVRPSSAPASVEPSVGPHPKSYMEIMAMVQRGEKPPGIKDINDLPPNPNQPPSNPRLAPKTKPWEVGQTQNSYSYGLQSQASVESSNSRLQGNGSISHLNGDNSSPWWQRKNVRITEIEPEDELRRTSYSAMTNERPVQRAWVPPQPPPVVMAEAAAAIRQPKQLIQKEGPGPGDERLLAQPSEEMDQLQKITKISESGGEVEINNGSSGPNLNEIEEHENGYEGN